MVPIAPWAIFGVVYNAAAGMVPLVYLIGLVAMIFTALSYAQMSKAFPIAGSVYSYVGRGLHPVLGLLRRLDDPARLPAGADAALRLRRRVDGRHLPGRAQAALDRGLPDHQHRDQLRRHLLHRDRQPAVPRRRADLRGDLRGDGRGRDLQRGQRRRSSAPTPLFNADLFTPAARRGRAVDRGAELPRLRRHRHPERGGQGRPPLGRHRHGHRPGARRRCSSSPRPGWRPCSCPARPQFGDDEVNNAFFCDRRLDQQQRLAGRLPGHERARRRHRQRRRRAERHLAAAVLDEPRRPAAPVPVPHQPQDQGARARDPGRRPG